MVDLAKKDTILSSQGTAYSKWLDRVVDKSFRQTKRPITRLVHINHKTKKVNYMATKLM